MIFDFYGVVCVCRVACLCPYVGFAEIHILNAKNGLVNFEFLLKNVGLLTKLCFGCLLAVFMSTNALKWPFQTCFIENGHFGHPGLLGGFIHPDLKLSQWGVFLVGAETS